MKEIKSAMNDLQLAAMRPSVGFGNLADARAALTSAIRLALISAGAPAGYMDKFDKMMSPD